MNNQTRETELDLLRIIALFYVICIHINARLSGLYNVMSLNWFGTKLWYMTWCVPIFVMISGRFFLDPDKDITLSSLYRKYLWRILIAFICWSLLYELFDAVTGRIQLTIVGHLVNAMSGPTHLWFLFMIAGLYILTPFFRKIAASKELSEYYLILSVIMMSLVSFGSHLPVIGTLIKTTLDTMRLTHLSGFGAYYVFGYYCKRYLVNSDRKKAIYCLGIIAFIAAFCGDTYLQSIDFSDIQLFTRYLTPTIFMVSAAIYLFVIDQAGKRYLSLQTISAITLLSRYSFGVYLLHYMIVWSLPLSFYTLCPMISVPIMALVVLALSLLGAVILRKLPVLGKFIA